MVTLLLLELITSSGSNSELTKSIYIELYEPIDPYLNQVCSSHFMLQGTDFSCGVCLVFCVDVGHT